MDVVWLKRDLRIHDHGPFAEIIKSNNPFCILYLFEPDQLSEPKAINRVLHNPYGERTHIEEYLDLGGKKGRTTRKKGRKTKSKTKKQSKKRKTKKNKKTKK